MHMHTCNGCRETFWFKEAFASISSQSSHYNGGVFVAVSQDYKSKDKTKSECIRRPIQKCLACIACGCTTNGGLEDQIGTTVGQASKTSDSRAPCVLGEILASTHQLSCHNLEVDELHVMHLGTTMYMLGAVLYMLCFHVLAGAPEDIMHGIWADINEFYRKHKGSDTIFQSEDWIIP